jgi:putative copper resistance protein D
VDEQLIVARAIHFAATMAVAGVMMFSLCVAEPAFLAGGGTHRVAVTVRARLAWFAWISFTIALASGAAWLIILAQQLSDGTVTAVLRDGIVRIVLTRTSFGADWTVRFGLAVLLAAILPFRFARQTPWCRRDAGVRGPCGGRPRRRRHGESGVRHPALGCRCRLGGRAGAAGPAAS